MSRRHINPDRKSVIVETRNRVAWITLNRPEVLNATNDQMGRELVQALRELGKDREVRCVILTGSGRAFCSGEDVDGFKARKFKGLDELLRQKYLPIIASIRGMEKPVIAGLNGIAAGGGASLALACDVRIASDKAGIKMAFIGMGLVPDAGASYFLAELVGRGRAIEMIMTGRTVWAKQALAMGLVNRVVPSDKLDAEVEKMAEQLATGPSTAIGLSKRVINQVPRMSLEEAFEFEAKCQRLASESNEHREAVQAFLEKRRTPVLLASWAFTSLSASPFGN